MKRVLCLLMLTIAVLTEMQGQDFTSRFMEQHPNDTSLHCLTVSPKMMERIIRLHPTEGNGETTERIFSKLKSARIVTSGQGKAHYEEAEKLLERNKQRFTLLCESRQDGTHAIFVRKRDGVISELVLLSLDKQQELFTIINFTGEMDNVFIETLTREWNDKKETE